MITGVVVMALTQFVMVGLMTMTPVHMRARDHAVTVTGLVISHVAAMFRPPLSGLLVDTFGTRTVAVSAGVVLPSGALAALRPGRRAHHPRSDPAGSAGASAWCPERPS